MSVRFNVIQHGNPSNPQAPKKYYPSIEATGRKTMRQLAGRISEMSTVSSTDTIAVLEAFLKIIPLELSDGNIVELGDFGNFWLKINSDGVDAREEVSAAQIRTVLPRFNPGKEFKKVLSEVQFMREG